MLVFCDGMPRSASTWSFNVALHLLKERFPSDEISSGQGRQPVETLKALQANVRHAVLKTHELTPLARAMIRIGTAKAIYTYRDAADSVASTMRAHGVSFRSAFELCAIALDLHKFHRETGIGLMIAYEDVVRGPAAVISRIAGYLLGERPPVILVRKIAKATSFEQMRKRSAQIDAGQLKLVNTRTTAYDPETLLYRNHIGNGTSGYGRQVLGPRQLARIDALCAKYDYF